MGERLEPKVRKEQILEAAIRVAHRSGYIQMRQADIAAEAGVAKGLVTRYFTTLTQLRRQVMRRAVKDGHHKIIAQGIAVKDPTALKAPREVKEAAIKSML